MRIGAWFSPPEVAAPLALPAPPPEPRKVRVHIEHRGTDTGDMTVQGWLMCERDGYLILERAVILEPGGKRVRMEGWEVPRERVLGVEPLVSVSVPELEEALDVVGIA